ncbi:MAG: hypothetical protein EPGJADBJ_02596 [Saprospiraceae bacterium]|nr:hypothetical protein [Saprospiraceae bacterium]
MVVLFLCDIVTVKSPIDLRAALSARAFRYAEKINKFIVTFSFKTFCNIVGN